MGGYEPGLGNNVITGNENQESNGQENPDVSKSILKAEKKVQRLIKSAPDFEGAGNEELLELKKLENEAASSSIEEGMNINDLLSGIEKEFKKDLKAMKRISKLKCDDQVAKQNFITNINSDAFSEVSEEIIYDFFATNRAKDITDHINNGGEFPQKDDDLQGFFDAFEVRGEQKDKFSEFTNDIKSIGDISNLSEIELRDISIKIDELTQMGFNFHGTGIEQQIVDIQTKNISITELNVGIVSDSTKTLEVNEKAVEEAVAEKAAEAGKAEQEAEKAEAVAEEAEAESKEAEKALEKLKVYANISVQVGSLDPESEKILQISESLANITDLEGRGEYVIEQVAKIEEYFLGADNKGENLKRLIEKAQADDKEKGNTGVNSLSKKLRTQFASVNPKFEQVLRYIPEVDLKSIPSPSPVPLIIGSITGNDEKIVRLSEDRYISNGSEFVFNDGEVEISSVDEYGFNIKQGDVDVSSLNTINDKLLNKQGDLNSLIIGGKDFKNKLEAELLEEIPDAKKIIELQEKIRNNKELIERKQEEMNALKEDFNDEKESISTTISADRKKNVEKSENALRVTGLTKFFSQSFIDELFARINLSPTLRTELGLSRPVNLSEGILGFSETLGVSEQRAQLGEMVNAIVSQSPDGPLNIDNIRVDNIGYGEANTEANVRTLISQNVMVMGMPDVSRALSNIKKSRNAQSTSTAGD